MSSDSEPLDVLDDLRQAALITERIRLENRDLLAQIEDYVQNGEDLRVEIREIVTSDDGSSDGVEDEDPSVVKKENDTLRREIARLIAQRERRQELFEDTEAQTKQLHQCTIDGKATDDALKKQSDRNDELIEEIENLKKSSVEAQESNWQLGRECKRAQQDAARRRDDAGLEKVAVPELSGKQRLVQYIEAQAQEIADAEGEIAALAGSSDLLKENIEDVVAKISDFCNDEKEQMAERLVAQINQTKRYLSDRELMISDLQVKLAREMNASMVIDDGDEHSKSSPASWAFRRNIGVNLLAEFQEIEQQEEMNSLSFAKDALMDELDLLHRTGANADAPEEQEQVLDESLEKARIQVETLRKEKEKTLAAVAGARRALQNEEVEKGEQIKVLRETCNERAANLETLLAKVCATEKNMDDAEENSSFLTKRMTKAHRLLMNKLKAEHANDGYRHEGHTLCLEERVDALMKQALDDSTPPVTGDNEIATLEKSLHKRQLHWDEIELNDTENGLQQGARKRCVEFFLDQALEALKDSRVKLENEQEAARVNDKKMVEEMKAAQEERLQKLTTLISDKRVLLENKKAMEAAVVECRSALWRITLSPLGRKRKHLLEQINVQICRPASVLQNRSMSFGQSYKDPDLSPSSSMTGGMKFTTYKSGGISNRVPEIGKYNSRSHVARAGTLTFLLMFKAMCLSPSLGVNAISDACYSTLRNAFVLLVDSPEPTLMPNFSIDDVVIVGTNVQVKIRLESYDSKKNAHERVLSKVVSSPTFIAGVNKKLGAQFDKVLAVGDPVFEAEVQGTSGDGREVKANTAEEKMRGCAVSDPILGEGTLLNIWKHTALVDWGNQSSEVPFVPLMMLPDIVTPLNVSVNEIVCKRTPVVVMGIVKSISKASVKITWDDDINVEEEVYLYNADRFTLRFAENWERNAYLKKHQCSIAW
eukprot:GEMP01005761.1.p1 GENE.GEMP01005761.1~~GEMP01005761.1.p1  ORF type:complete len:939 (+),score=234.17 GEMP01005761.1:119-2935(+)